MNVPKTREAKAKTFGCRNCRIRSGMEDSVKTTGISCTVVQRSFQEHGQVAPRTAEILLASPWRRLEQPRALNLNPSPQGFENVLAAKTFKITS